MANPYYLAESFPTYYTTAVAKTNTKIIKFEQQHCFGNRVNENEKVRSCVPTRQKWDPEMRDKMKLVMTFSDNLFGKWVLTFKTIRIGKQSGC